MKAVILAAGEGTRLRPFTENMPKVMVPVANKPILLHIINALSENNIRDIVIVVGYKKESVMNYFGNGKEFGVNITYVTQEKQIGTGHALLQAKDEIEGEFISLPGDNLIDGKSISSLIKKECETSMLVEKSQHPSKYGVVKVEDGKIRGIVEKPEKAETNLVSTGIYKFPPDIFDVIGENVKNGKNHITDSLHSMIEDGREICAVMGNGRWMDIIYPWNWLDVNSKSLKDMAAITSGKLEKNVILKGDVSIGEGTVIHSGCYIVGPVIIGSGCEIGPNVCIFPSTSIGDDVVIYPFTEIRSSIIMDNATIGSHSSVSKSIVGKGTKISSHFSNIVGNSIMEIEESFYKINDVGAFIGDGCKIEDSVVVKPGKIIGRNCIVGPLNVIDKNIPGESEVI